MARKLRPLGTDFRKLKAYAGELGIRVRFNSSRQIRLAGGKYAMGRGAIYLSPKFRRCPAVLSYVLAHEIGHAEDFLSQGKRLQHLTMQTLAFFNLWNQGTIRVSKKILRKLRSFMISHERDAHDRADRILREQGVRIPRHLSRKIRELGLQSYRDVFAGR